VNGGMFTDQRWVDLLSAFLPKLVVLRDPGYNIAYWNLHERTIRRTDDGWRVTFSDGTECDLVFFHFSGFSPKRPELSKHENRFQDRPPGDVGQLLTQYGGALGAADFDRLSDCRVPVPRFDSGPAWDPVCRTLYRNALRDEVDVGDPLVGHSFLQYAAGTDEGETLPRYLVALLQSRSDLADIYDSGHNARGLRRWLAGSGRDELHIDPALLQALGLDDERPNGANYVGYLRSHLGVGEAARNAIAALGAAGIRTTTHDISDTAESPQGHYELSTTANLRNGARHPITILGVNADQTPLVLRSLKDDLRSTFLVGYWAWETPEFPEEWCDRFDLLDEVWVGSQFIAKAVRAKSTIPVTVVPHMVSPPRMERDRPWLVATVPDVQADEFVFLFLFDIASVPFRKNPEGAIAAFTSAFGPDERVRLIVKTLNGDRNPELLQNLVRMGADHRVTIWDEALDTMDRFRLLASVDALVSLHRAEGFGLTIAEAMAYGLPVVTTGWSGNVDFANADNAALVNFDLIKTDRPHGPYPAGTLWAEPRLADAARQMRRVRDDAAWRARIGVAAAATIAAQLSPTAVGAIMRKRIDWLSNLAEMDYPRSAGAAVVRTMGPVRGRRLISASAAIAILVRDLPRRPLFYLARAHRLPRLLMGDGFRYSVHRGATFARTNRAAPAPGSAHATSPLGGVKPSGVKLNVQRLFRHLRFKMPL
jgi:glycosyltransferase involved in cell wall biosynthesis